MPRSPWIACAFVAALSAPNASAQPRTYHPRITQNTAPVIQHGATMTITGSDLAPLGWRRTLSSTLRFAGGGGTLYLDGFGATQITVPADKHWRGDSVRIEWIDDPSDTLDRIYPIPANERVQYLPLPFVVQAPPDLTFAGNSVTPDIGPPFVFMTQQNGNAVLKGKWLRRNSVPTVTFTGSPMSGVSHSYEPQGFTNGLSSCCSSGADRLTFFLPPQKATGWMVVDNTLGRDSIAVTVSPPPAPSQVVQQTPNGNAPLSPANTLVRGGTYVIRGQYLSVSHTLGGTTSIKRGIPQLGSTTITPVFASDTNVVFTVPSNFTATSAALSVGTIAGLGNVGTFSVADAAPVAVDVASVSGAVTTLLPGRVATFSVVLNLPTNTKDYGNLVVTQTSGPINALKLPAPIKIVDARMDVKVQATNVQVSTPVTIRIAHESAGTTTQSQSMSFIVRPPRPIAIEGHSSVNTGATHNFRVRFDSGAYAGGLFVLLSSSNPNVAAVPASATLTKDYADFAVSVPPSVQAGSSATLTATLDGTSVTFPVTTHPPQVQSISLKSGTTGTVLPGGTFRVEVTLTGLAPTANGLSITSGDTALDAQGNVVGATPSTLGDRFVRDFRATTGLLQQRTVTITATTSMQSRTATVTLVPVLVSTFTPTPTSGRNGETLTATAIFSVPPAQQMHIAFASADTSRATVSPATAVVAAGATSKVVSILLKGSPSTPRQVPITVTLRAGSSSGPIVSTQTTLVTLNP